MRDLNRRQFIDLALNTAKVGGLAVLLGQIPYDELAKKLGVKPQHLPLVFRDWDLQAEAATLPLNYVSRDFLVASGADPRDGIAALTVDSGSGSGSSSSSDNISTALIKNGGTKNIFVTMTGSGGTRTHNIRWTVANNMSDNPTLGMRVYNETGMNSYLFDACNNAGATQVFRFGQVTSPTSSNQRGWQYYQWFRDESSAINSPLWTSDIIRMNATFSAGNGATSNVYVDQMYYDGYQRPVIGWIFEGGIDTHYSVVFGAWTAKRMTGTIAIPTSSIGNSGFLTEDNITEMVAAGWDVIHMSDTTTALTGLTVQQVIDRVSAAEAYLRSRGWTSTPEAYLRSKGWTRTPKVIALPGTATTSHRTDDNVITALSQLGYTYAIDKWGDGGAAASSPLGLDPIYGFSLNPYRVPAWRTENPDVLSEYQFHVRHAIMAGGIRILRTGSVAGSGTSGMINPADHTALLNEIALKHYAGTLSCLPWRQVQSGLSGRMVR